ncbi:recombinase family protein [Brevundimonas sp.]|uniref:recombinase family protein n=1 Tax=Brevundimonas sp. TaxID=1871086 RepID=UPI00286AE54F|nr:recombinase family protein [Brevundimonas sp.]
MSADDTGAPGKIPAAQYLRMSTDRQQFSLEAQAVLIAAFAELEGYEIVETYQDAGRSGVTITGREGLKRLLRDVVSGPAYKSILVADVSRWGRYQDPDEAAHYEFLCRDAGVRVRYCAEAFADDGSITSGLVKNMKRLMAAEYSRQLSDRCRAGLHRAVRAGGRGGGPTPYGFVRGTLDPATSELRALGPGELKGHIGDQVRTVHGPPDQVATIRRIFAMHVREVRSPGEIAHRLNASATPYSRPGPWDTDRVKRVLANELVVGIQVTNRSRFRFGEREYLAEDQWERIRVGTPVVTAATFAKAQERLKSSLGLNHTDDELLAGARRIVAKYGHLSPSLIAQHAWASLGTYNVRFRSMAGIARRIDYSPASGQQRLYADQNALGADQVRSGLSRLLAQEGYLSQSLINQTPYLPHADTLRKQFGSMRNIYALIGYRFARSHLPRTEKVDAAGE